ncbi:MAG TPA: hypothetical protein VHG27_05100 [Xanthobacteraceae bacterium]|nr:hypothetical protein [Xanthobacteraceae bacterium]
MWSHDGSAASPRLYRLGAAMLIAALAGGCFQPLYGERSLTGGPGLRGALASVDVAEIPAQPATAQARLAVEVRNELTYALNHGGDALPPTHRLNVAITVTNQQLIVDPTTARGEFEVVALNATYSLVELSSSKRVVEGTATARSSYDIPGQQQRYAMLRGQRESQSRAAKVIAEQIRNRLASYFAAGS